ncbi:alpha/beta fold hydrolase [Romeriopsis navalis]|nr:alpha/beta hydrolase [Romeriopsis navalis]
MPLSVHPLHAQIAGTGSTMLCLHGHPGSGRSMDVFSGYFCDRFQTIAPDLRGYGRSQTQQPFTITQHLDDLVALLDRHQVQRTIVLGWSLGGIFALELALRYPERVSGLILVATAARPWGDHPRIRLRDNLLTGVAGGLNFAKPGWQWNIDTFGRRSLFRYLVQQHRPDVYRFLARDAVYAYMKTSRQADRALNQAIRQGYNRVPDMAQISVPALMLMAAHDRHISPAASRETAKALPNCEWECFADTAHLLPWEIPEQLRARIDRWLVAHPEVIPMT